MKNRLCIKAIFLLFVYFTNTVLLAETIRYPYYSSRDTGSIQIDSIKRSSAATIVYGRYKNFFANDSWCNINSQTKLIDCNTGKAYKILRSEGIFMSPSKLKLNPSISVVNFQFIFEPIPMNTKYLDLIEMEDYDAFNFYGLDLTGKKRNLTLPDFIDDKKDIIMPSFPGGESVLLAWLSNNVYYPPKAQENHIQGKVLCSFVVEKDGSISEIEIISSPHPLLSAAAIQAVSMMPKWNPGKKGDKLIKVRITVPIAFRLY